MDIKAIFYIAIAGIVVAIYGRRLTKGVIRWAGKHRTDKTATFEAEHQQAYDDITLTWRKLRNDTRIAWHRYLQAKASHDQAQRRTTKKEVTPYIEFCETFLQEIQRAINHDHSMLRKLPQANAEQICYQHHSEWYRLQDAVAIMIARAKDIYKNEMSKGW